MLDGNKTSTGRKSHQCDVCNSEIAKGEKQVTRSGVQRNETPFRMHMHPECERYSAENEWDWEWGEEVSRSQVLEWAKGKA